MQIPTISNILRVLYNYSKRCTDVVSIRKADDKSVFVSATDGKIAVRVYVILNQKEDGISKIVMIRGKFWKILEKEDSKIIINNKGIYADGVLYPTEDELKKALIDTDFNIFEYHKERDSRFTVEFETKTLERMCVLARRLNLTTMKMKFTSNQCIIESENVTIVSSFIV